MRKDILIGWRIGFVMGVLLFLICFNIVIISAGEIKNVEYKLKIVFEPYCTNETCVLDGNSSNSTCSTQCYGKFTIEGVEENNLYFIIDTASDDWKDGRTDTRYGYKTFEMGNTSDITGLREDLQKCLFNYDNLLTCEKALNARDVNLTNCILQSGFSENYTLQKCKEDKIGIQTQLNTKDSSISEKIKEVEDLKQEKLMWIGLGLLAGFLGTKFGIPWMQGRGTPKDEAESSFPSNTGY